MSIEFFVDDESKVHGYTIVAAAVHSQHAVNLRKRLVSLRMKGQRRIHFVDESPPRRRMLLSEMARLECRARIYRVHDTAELRARELCLSAVVNDMAVLNARRLVLERDESIVQHDRRAIRAALIERRLHGRVTYAHEAATSEPLLWISDAVAWSYSRGGEWRQRAAPIVVKVTDLRP